MYYDNTLFLYFEDILNDTTAKFQGRQAGPSYIKGDPLNGY